MKEKVNPNGLLIVSPLGPKSPKRKIKKKRKTEFRCDCKVCCKGMPPKRGKKVTKIFFIKLPPLKSI